MTDGSATEGSASPRFRLGFLTHVQGRGDQVSTYGYVQELFVVADELGFDVGWVAQHHVSLGGGGLPSPWTFLAYAAARTRRIRLATAITILRLEDPVRLAEDVSVVDTLSGGRVEIGVGSGGSVLEYAAFGRDVSRRRELTSEGLAVLRKALANGEVGAPGFTIQPPARDFTDRIWQGVFSGPGAEYAAASGSNLLLNRATYGYDEPTDAVQRPWAEPTLPRGTGRAHRASGCRDSSSPPPTGGPRSPRSGRVCSRPRSGSPTTTSSRRDTAPSRRESTPTRRSADSTPSTATRTRSSRSCGRSRYCRSPRT